MTTLLFCDCCGRPMQSTAISVRALDGFGAVLVSRDMCVDCGAGAMAGIRLACPTRPPTLDHGFTGANRD